MYKSYIEVYYDNDLPHQKRARKLIKMLALKGNEKILNQATKKSTRIRQT